MKKILSSLAFTLLFLAGCSGSNSEPSEQKAKNYVFNNQQESPFSLNLTAPFKLEEKSIYSENENDFPVIHFDFSKNTDKKNLLSIVEDEKEFQAKKCSNKEACPEISEPQTLKINNYDSLKYSVKYPSKNPVKEGAFMNNYHYSFLFNNEFIHFWIYAADLENPEKAEKEFTDIINTISFSSPKKETELKLNDKAGE